MSRPARSAAAQAAFARCPRCGSPREPDQRYCLECGLALPRLDGVLATLRRGWVARLGWYPGDFVWAALAVLALAVALAAASIALGRWRGPGAGSTVVAPAPSSTPLPAARGGGWPAGKVGYTVVLASFPAAQGATQAAALAAHAAAQGLPRVGVLDSSGFASLPAGYAIVFSGVYGSAAEAQTALPSVRVRGYAGAYVVPVG